MVSLKSQKWQIDNIETVLFDKDGTFIDLHYFWGKMTELRVLELIRRYNLSTDLLEKICLFLGYDIISKKMLSDGITALYSRVKIIEIFKRNLEEIGLFVTEEDLTELFDDVSQVFYKEIEKYTKPIAEAVEFIKILKKYGVKLGIVTSDSVESTKLTIKNFHWEDLFDVVIGRESSKETKESGVPTRMALEVLKSNPSTTVMIGDAPMDSISAKNAGINKTILVATGQLGIQELENSSRYVLESLKDLECLKI